jgi:hypothetical protein
MQGSVRSAEFSAYKDTTVVTAKDLCGINRLFHEASSFGESSLYATVSAKRPIEIAPLRIRGLRAVTGFCRKRAVFGLSRCSALRAVSVASADTLLTPRVPDEKLDGID